VTVGDACLPSGRAPADGRRVAWIVDRDDMVTEGSASNAYIVDWNARLVTQPLSERIPRRKHTGDTVGTCPAGSR